jgi:glycosyltransferase involved in cell wall biosynthesis
MSKLVFFTNAYPYGWNQNWNAHELVVFGRYFDNIVIAPLSTRDGQVDPNLPSRIRVLPAITNGDNNVFSKLAAISLVGPRLLNHGATLRDWLGTGCTARAKKAILASIKAEQILRSKVFRDWVMPELEGSSLYFTWGLGYAEVVPYLPERFRQASLVRFHGYDLYWERNDGYLPLQKSIVESAAVLSAVSHQGADYLRQHYPTQAHKVHCLHLGTSVDGWARPSDDGTLRLLSCAYVNPVKRLHLIVECLAQFSRPVEWTHIGDGPLLPDLIKLSKNLPPHITCRFLGRLPPTVVTEFYDGRAIDVFVNVSESEGIPVSIMEAMAAGIPAVATNVGGIAELVDNEIGRLLRPNFTASEFVAKVNELIAIDPPRRTAIRDACRQKIADEFDIERNSEAMASTLLTLAPLAKMRRAHTAGTRPD